MISRDAIANASGMPRSAVKLGNEFEKRLSSYAGSAVAAGVGLLAMAKSADAKVVYTPAHIEIPVSDTQKVPLDLNHDGKVDFSFANRSYIGRYGYGRFALTIIAGNSRNQIGVREAACLRDSPPLCRRVAWSALTRHTFNMELSHKWRSHWVTLAPLPTLRGSFRMPIAVISGCGSSSPAKFTTVGRD